MSFEKIREALGESRREEERGLALLEQATAVKVASPASPRQNQREIACASAIQHALIECGMGYLADARETATRAYELAETRANELAQEAQKLVSVGEVTLEAEPPAPTEPGPDPRVIPPADNGPPPWAGQPGTPS